MYNPVIFDLDGTLLNTLGDLAAAGNYALSQLGFPTHDLDKYRYFVGNGIPKLIERMLPESASQSDFDAAYKLFDEYYERHKTDATAPYSGIPELLKTLSERGITCLCNTNKSLAVNTVSPKSPLPTPRIILSISIKKRDFRRFT